MMIRRIFVVTLAFALLAAACGDSGETTTTGEPPATTEAPGTTEPPATTAPPPTTGPVDGPTFLWAGAKYPVARYEACFGSPNCPEAQLATNEPQVGLKRELYGQMLERHRDVAFKAPPGEEDDPITKRATYFCAYDPRLILYREDVIARSDLTGRPNIDEESIGEIAGRLPEGIGAVQVVAGIDVDAYDEVVAILNDLGLSNDGSVGLNYVYLPAPRWQWGPGGDPVPVPGPAPPPPQLGSGAEVLVFDAFRPREILNGVRDPVTGHGEFIVDIVQQLGPAAKGVPVDDDSRELITDLTFFEAAAMTDDISGAVVNASFGIYPCPLDSGADFLQPVVLPITLQAIVTAGAVLVAAAGNDGLATPPFMPAAFAVTPEFGQNVVSVGAFSPGHLGDLTVDYADRTTLLDAVGNANTVSAGGAVANFSNHGDWVEVYAPGVFVPADYPAPPASDPDDLWHGLDPTEFVYSYLGGNGQDVDNYDKLAEAVTQIAANTGPAVEVFMAADAKSLALAQWSGTSFAAPHVAAAIAAAATGNTTVLEACAAVFTAGVCGP